MALIKQVPELPDTIKLCRQLRDAAVEFRLACEVADPDRIARASNFMRHLQKQLTSGDIVAICDLALSKGAVVRD